MRYLMIVMFAAVALAACNKKNETNDCQPAASGYPYQANKTVSIEPINTSSPTGPFRYQIVDGGNFVFKYDSVYQYCPQTADVNIGRYRQTIVFEVSATTASFRFADSAVLRQNQVCSRLIAESVLREYFF